MAQLTCAWPGRVLPFPDGPRALGAGSGQSGQPGWSRQCEVADLFRLPRTAHRCCGTQAPYDEELLAALKAWRLETANAASQPAFVIFTDATLQAIAEATPADRSQLLRISGIGAVKADRFGEDVLRIIAERTAPGQ